MTRTGGPRKVPTSPVMISPIHDQESEGLEPRIPARQIEGQQSDHDPTAVEGRNRQQVEDAEEDVHENHRLREGHPESHHEPRSRAAHDRERVKDQRPCNREHQVHPRTRRRHVDHVALRVTEASKINRHGFRPAEEERSVGGDENRRENQGSLAGRRGPAD